MTKVREKAGGRVPKEFGDRLSAGTRFELALLLGFAWATSSCAFGQIKHTPVSIRYPSTTSTGVVTAGTASALVQMAGRASVIFAGHVESVFRNDAAGFVDVRFRIDQATRGCPNTGVYVLREWAGLWSGHADRYRVGQRLLMLLPPRGPSGMSAPIGGMDGAIPIVATGNQPIADMAGVAPKDDGAADDPAASSGVDLRWIAARAERAIQSTPSPQRAISFGAVGRPAQPSPGGPVGEGWNGPVTPLNPSGSNGAVAAAPVSLSSVLSLLRGVGDGAR